ncbi:MAG: cupin domain-containing protein [Chloroflexi bacterium]|nr:cupin domain-containing protein [Chloroflexota bacterium]
MARRVVTGNAPDGKAVIASDGEVPRVVRLPGMPDFAIAAVWATDWNMTAVPGSEDPTAQMTTFVPGPAGTRFLISVLPPDSAGVEPGTDIEELMQAQARELPGLAEAMERDHPGMHTTDTVDYDIIMSGELYLELDDGAEVHLKPGDIVIQTGTRHAWRNRGPGPCVMYSVLVGAPRQV